MSGKLSKLSGSCPNVTFEVKKRHVYTTSATQYREGSCRNLRKDADVEVRGTEMPDSRVRADRITFDNDSEVP